MSACHLLALARPHDVVHLTSFSLASKSWVRSVLGTSRGSRTLIVWTTQSYGLWKILCLWVCLLCCNASSSSAGSDWVMDDLVASSPGFPGTYIRTCTVLIRKAWGRAKHSFLFPRSRSLLFQLPNLTNLVGYWRFLVNSCYTSDLQIFHGNKFQQRRSLWWPRRVIRAAEPLVIMPGVTYK